MRAVTFDFWWTLFRDRDSELRHTLRAEALARAACVPGEDAAEALRAAMAEFARVHIAEQRTLGPLDAVDFAARRLGVVVAEEKRAPLAERFASVILEHPPEPVEGALDAVRAVAARMPAGLISDTGISPGKSLRVLLERNGFLPHLRCLTFSDEIGVAKPQSVLFTRTAAALGVDVTDILHVGDLEPTDIAGIQALGGRGGLFTAVNDRYAAETRAEHLFTDWPAFLDWLDSIKPHAKNM